MRDSDRAAGSRELKDRREAVETPAAGAHTSASGFLFQAKEAVQGGPAPPWGPGLLRSTGRAGRDVGGRVSPATISRAERWVGCSVLGLPDPSSHPGWQQGPGRLWGGVDPGSDVTQPSQTPLLRQTLLPAAGAAVTADTTQVLCVTVATNSGISRLCPSSSFQLCFSITLGQV